MTRALAEAWSLLWHVALGLCGCFALLDALAPPQDLPWKPLDLTQPVGMATTAKIAALEPLPNATPESVETATERCLQTLRAAGVRVERASDRDDGGFCVVRGAVRLSGGTTPLAPAGLVMQCPLAVRYALWDRHTLQPAAEEILGARATRVETYGTYACRRVYGSSDTARRPSEHARANALDVAAVRLEDGRTIAVLDAWDATGRAGPEGAAFLRRLRDSGCRLFANVLTPDYNAAHRDHLHLDGAARGVCA